MCFMGNKMSIKSHDTATIEQKFAFLFKTLSIYKKTLCTVYSFYSIFQIKYYSKTQLYKLSTNIETPQ